VNQVEPKRNKVNWKSAWNQWPKPAEQVVRALRAAVVGEKAPGNRASTSLRDPWTQLIMVANNAAQGFDDDGTAFFRELRETFDANARTALVKTIVAQVDLEKAGNVTPEWTAGPFGASSVGGKPWLTPFHPAIEIALYARLLLEVDEPAAARDLMGGLHHQLLTIVNMTYGDREWGAMARKQVLDGWSKLVASKATATFGFPEVQGWAERVTIAAASSATHEEPPQFDDAFRALAKNLVPTGGKSSKAHP
jgi:hypothetical protein